MALTLVVIEGSAKGQMVRIDDAYTDIGSARAATMTLDDAHVAGVHLKLVLERGDVRCHDVSGAGFLHNGSRTDSSVLAVGDEVGIGGQVLKLLSDSAQPASRRKRPLRHKATREMAALDSSELEDSSAAVEAVRPSPGEAILVALQGNDAGRRYDLATGRTNLLGRGPSTDIPIWDIRASRVHCRIDLANNEWVLADLGSTNGLFVNKKRVARHVLRSKDVIKIGATQLRFLVG